MQPAGRAAGRRLLLHTAAAASAVRPRAPPAIASSAASASGAAAAVAQGAGGAFGLRRGWRAFHGGLAARLAEIVMNVPGMGDSITEGTIKAWSKQVGERVAVDEVVCVIETDKVSVDIRAQHAGVLAEQYANVDDTVEVGAKLLKIDTAGTPSAPAAPSAQQQAPAPAAPAPAPAPPSPAAADASSSHAGMRKPLIKFLGKRSLLPKTAGHAPSSAVGPAAAVASAGGAPPVRYEDIKGTPGAKLFNELPPMFGRPALSPQEVAAIESGGAD